MQIIHNNGFSFYFIVNGFMYFIDPSGDGSATCYGKVLQYWSTVFSKWVLEVNPKVRSYHD
jgi:hypothetical protein